MPLRDLLKKRDKIAASDTPTTNIPEFVFYRSDTNTQELIHPPSLHRKSSETPPPNTADSQSSSHEHHSRLSIFKGRSRSNSATSTTSKSSDKSAERPKSKRLSHRLGLHKDEPTSDNVPQDLPTINIEHDTDAAWEERATILARENEKNRSRPGTPLHGSTPDLGALKLSDREDGKVSTKDVDDNIQEAIRLHEAGELEKATRMFGRMADPKGENNALSQVLYALALR